VIPVAHLHQWSQHAPWVDLRQVEQDLIISRALADLFSSESLRGKLAFRGGTAINKLLFAKPLRYSEDIDLVQIQGEPIKNTVAEIRQVLSWLGKCSFSAAAHSVQLVFRFSPETDSASQMKLKVEINTREHESLYGLRRYPFAFDSDWYRARAELVSYEPEELFGTKLRALLQRHKNRDLFDLHQGLLQSELETDRVVATFEHYLRLEGLTISRANAEERMLKKLNRSLTEDVVPLLPSGITFSDGEAMTAFSRVWHGLIQRIAGEPWKSTQPVIEKLRQSRWPGFLSDAAK
jgi:predicted nucleotidyltransferase component of viral defense system